MQAINIFSGEPGLGGALTNPTELARRKGMIDCSYAVRYRGRDWPDAETAYHALKTESAADNDATMVDLIEAKFRQHPSLADEVRARGGREFLLSCSHFTNSKSDAGGWEGQGVNSRFIRNLLAGFDRLDAPHASEGGQALLF
jgi:hypothetical protein